MSKEVLALGWAVELETMGDGVSETVSCPLARFSREHLEFGDGLFDGTQIGAVRRQVEQLGLAIFDRFPNASDIVATRIVHEATLLQRGDVSRSRPVPRCGYGFTAPPPKGGRWDDDFLASLVAA